MPNEILIDGIIGNAEDEISAAMVKAMLDTADRSKPLVVRIHSEGGSVFEGFAIYDALRAYDGPKKAIIESYAASIASFIPMAFDEIEITPNGYMMLHNPWMETTGDAASMAKTSELLATVQQNMVEAYASRSGKSQEEIQSILTKETYLNAQQAKAFGFVTAITDKPVTAKPLAKTKSMPHGVVAALLGADPSGEKPPKTKGKTMSDGPVAATLQEIKAAFPKAKAEFILRQLERNAPLASVAAAAAEEMMQENETLKAQLEEMTAKCSEMEAKMKAMEVEISPDEEPEEEEPAAKKTGAAPVARSRQTGSGSAVARWKEAVAAEVKACGGNKQKALSRVNAKYPGLREEMLKEQQAVKA